jgi:N-methylhydantoinase B
MPMRTLALSKGDLFTHVAPGGAGNGDPLERDPDHVAADVRDGRFTREFARDVYGVVTGANGRADRVATDIRRDGLASDLPKLAEAQLRLFMEGDQGRAALSPEYEGELA